jgi:hypothetical protein
MNSVQAFIDDIKGEKTWVEELNEHSRNVAQHFKDAPLDRTNEALWRFTTLFPKVSLVALGLVAIDCSSLVDRGGDPASAGPARTAGTYERTCKCSSTDVVPLQLPTRHWSTNCL